MKVFRRYGKALEERQPDEEILRIGGGKESIYITGMRGIDSIDAIGPAGALSGWITLSHLVKGNHNWSDVSQGRKPSGISLRLESLALQAIDELLSWTERENAAEMPFRILLRARAARLVLVGKYSQRDQELLEELLQDPRPEHLVAIPE